MPPCRTGFRFTRYARARNDAEDRYHRQRRGILSATPSSRRTLSDAPGPARGRLRRRRPDRHPGALRRRQARHAARPARHRREQDRRRRHARDARRAGAAGRRLQPAALHAFRVDQHGSVQEPGLQAHRPRADFADREVLLRPRGRQRDPGEPIRRARAIRQGASRRGQLRDARRGLGAGDPGAADREARRHLDEPRSVPHRFSGHAGPDRRPGAYLRLADHRRRAAAPGQATQDSRRSRAPRGSRACPTCRR